MKAGKPKKTPSNPVPTRKPKKQLSKRATVAGKTSKSPKRAMAKDVQAGAGDSLKSSAKDSEKAVELKPPVGVPLDPKSVEQTKSSLAQTEAVKVMKAPKPAKKEVAREVQAQSMGGVSKDVEAKAVVSESKPKHVKESGATVSVAAESIELAKQVTPGLQHPSAPGPEAPKARRERQPRPVLVEIPSILLEPDHLPNETPISGPGARFALTTERETAVAGAPTELPESYGTQQIFLAARDPYCLFASWDLDVKQRARYNSASASGALTIRLRRGFVEGPIHLEVHTLPNARDRFIEVGQPDTTFVAELGYHEKNSGLWRSISVSKPVTTPRDRMAPALAPTVAETPRVEATVSPIAEPEAARESQRWDAPNETGTRFESQTHAAEAIFAVQASAPTPRWEGKQEPDRQQPRWETPKEKPRWSPPRRVAAPNWSASKTKQLEDLISLEVRRMQQGSLEIEEVLRRRVLRGEEEAGAPSSLDLLEEVPGEEIVAEALGLAQSGPSSLEAAAPSAKAQKGFWFKVNAELIIYGSTEPDAHVAIGGRPIRLRPDGTFSYRFALPDGAYELPVVAIARDGDASRAAELRFSRASVYWGEVPAHPQDPALKKPTVENL